MLGIALAEANQATSEPEYFFLTIDADGTGSRT